MRYSGPPSMVSSHTTLVFSLRHLAASPRKTTLSSVSLRQRSAREVHSAAEVTRGIRGTRDSVNACTSWRGKFESMTECARNFSISCDESAALAKQMSAKVERRSMHELYPFTLTWSRKWEEFAPLFRLAISLPLRGEVALTAGAVSH